MKTNDFMKRSIKLKSLYLSRQIEQQKKDTNYHHQERKREHHHIYIYITKIDSRRNRNHKSHSIFKI